MSITEEDRRYYNWRQGTWNAAREETAQMKEAVAAVSNLDWSASTWDEHTSYTKNTIRFEWGAFHADFGLEARPDGTWTLTDGDSFDEQDIETGSVDVSRQTTDRDRVLLAIAAAHAALKAHLIASAEAMKP